MRIVDSELEEVESLAEKVLDASKQSLSLRSVQTLAHSGCKSAVEVV